jgi:hypothetical protein
MEPLSIEERLADNERHIADLMAALCAAQSDIAELKGIVGHAQAIIAQFGAGPGRKMLAMLGIELPELPG